MWPGQQYADEASFISANSPYSVGVEVVSAQPGLTQTDRGPYQIFDHHTGVGRLATLAACQQAWNAVNLGFMHAFTPPGGEYNPTVVINDCDQDVTLTYQIVCGAPVIPRLDHREIERIDELVRVEGMLDVFGGVPPGRITPKLLKAMERIAWIFDAYTSYRSSGELFRNNPDSHREVMQEGMRRINQHIAGRGRSRSLDTRYNTIGSVRQCRLVQCIGAEARLGACSDGAQALITWQQRNDGRHQYTYYRRSPYVPFNLNGPNGLYQTLNQAENRPPNQGHGGSDTIGGSPRANGSMIDPDQLLQILNDNPAILNP